MSKVFSRRGNRTSDDIERDTCVCKNNAKRAIDITALTYEYRKFYCDMGKSWNAVR